MDDDNDNDDEVGWGLASDEKEAEYFWMSTYLIVDSTPCDGVFITNFGFLIFPRFPIISPLKLIRTLASENKNPTILNMIGFRFIFDARLLILCGN